MNSAEDAVELSPVKRALLEVRALRARVAELEAQAHEPIAIVGMSVRAPGGVHDVAAFADLLWAGRDAITDIPNERWPLADWFAEEQDAPGKMYTRYGGFLADVAGFDAEFFGIAPVEAASMDPQQRLVLELSWEALEHANHAPASLAGTRAGIYLGVSNSDYGRALFAQPELIDPYFSAGNAFSVAAGRVAYVLGCHGPAIAIDTACSSSLVGLHLAVQGLRRGDCDLALAGGVNLMLTPELNVNFSKAGMMSRDGRCRTFDAAASGYVRGEGGGIVVLRRLRDALAAGDRVLAVIRGSAINQDGRSNGLTAPNGPAQQAVLRAALADAGIPAAQVSYIEAHGTGTSLGDPIEVGAIAAVFSEGRAASAPLALGSVKTNIGHLEAAAGIVGVIKTVLALQRREVPPHLHLRTRNPLIDWNALPLTIPTTVTPWAAIDGRRVAGVSAFGFSGTNAHVVLEAAPDRAHSAPTAARAPHVLALSARNPQALRELAQRYRETLAALPSTVSARDVCHSANTGRTHFACRVSVLGATVPALVEALDRWLGEVDDPRVVASAGSGAVGAPRIAFLYPGQGPQYAGMGRELYDSAPAYRRAFDECAAELSGVLGRPITPIVFPADGSAALLDRTENAQPALFALEYALGALWRSWGVQPNAVMGHSFGEYAAACLAGVLTLADAARMVVARGRLSALALGDGAMMILEASAEEVEPVIREAGGALSIAAINGPKNTVISGERGAVELVAAQFAARRRRTTPLRVSHAFHSPLMDSVLAGFERELEGVRYAAPSTTFISNLTGEAAGLETIGRSGYWRDHLRQPVRFAQSIQALAGKGITHYLELSPHPVLLGMGAECVAGGTWLPSLRKEQSAWAELLHTLQVLYADGFNVDWAGVTGERLARSVTLPTYPFQRTRHWIEFAAKKSAESVDLWSAVERDLQRESPRGPLDLNVASYADKWACLARLTDVTAYATLRELGAFKTPGERHTLESLLGVTGIVDSQRRLMSRWLARLVNAGALRRDGDVYEATLWQPAPLPALWADATQRLGDNLELLAYVRNCADHLAGILTGRVSALESLFPGGSFELARALYERSATMRYINGLAGAALSAACQALPPGAALRVLEIGGGTGGTTSALLRALPAERTRYRFTDVSEAFMGEARTRFAGYPSLEFGTFDLELDPVQQGYAPGSFDVIVSANCVHAATDLRAALTRIRQMLAPGGVLILVESTVHLDYFDMTTGLIEGWQHFTDDLRGEDPLLPPDAWISALRAAGMVEAKAWPERGSAPEVLGQHVIVALNPGRAETHARLAPSTTNDGAPVHTALPVAPTQTGAIRRRLEAELPSEHLSILCEVVRAEVVRILRLDPAAPPARHERLMDLGMDSLMAVQLRNALDRALEFEKGRGLPSTLMFDYPTIEAIAEFVRQRLAPATPPAAAARALTAERARSAEPAPLAASAIAELSDDEIASLLEQRGRP
ncbi:MAG: beta-ketoacyl synthase N-terminal-like domain-containing protein [Polyangiaceae bacterium]